jgi:AcrR family transcriptional regulator
VGIKVNKKNKREEILEAVFRLFAQEGYALSIKEIAALVGLKPASIYSHFESKEQIVLLTVEREVDHFYSLLEEIAEKSQTQSSRDLLEQLFFFTVNYFSEMQRMQFWQHLLAMPDEDVQMRCRQFLKNQENRIGPKLSAMGQHGVATGEIRAIAAPHLRLLFNNVLLGALESMLIFGWPPQKAMMKARIVWEHFCAGIFVDDKTNMK